MTRLVQQPKQNETKVKNHRPWILSHANALLLIKIIDKQRQNTGLYINPHATETVRIAATRPKITSLVLTTSCACRGQGRQQGAGCSVGVPGSRRSIDKVLAAARRTDVGATGMMQAAARSARVQRRRWPWGRWDRWRRRWLNKGGEEKEAHRDEILTNLFFSCYTQGYRIDLINSMRQDFWKIQLVLRRRDKRGWVRLFCVQILITRISG